MSGLPEKKGEHSDPVWKEEFFYFGNAGWPSSETYRSSGERLQIQIEKALPLSKDKSSSHYRAEAKEVADFVSKYEDCEFIVSDSYQPLGSDERTEPYLWIVGWRELTTQEERQQYEQDKKDSM